MKRDKLNSLPNSLLGTFLEALREIFARIACFLHSWNDACSIRLEEKELAMRKIFAVTLLFIVFGARAQTKPTPQPAEQRKQWVQALELVLAEAETETQDLDLSAAERKLLLAKNRAKASDGREILGEDVDLLEEGPPDAKKVVFVFEDQEPRTHYGADTIWMIGDPRKDEVGAGILYACGIAKLRDGDEASTKLMRVLHAKLRQAKQQ